MAALTALCYGLSIPLRLKPPLMAALLCVLPVAADTLTGQALLKDSLLSGYALSGIRFYGIGNEYLGVLLGMTLAGGFAWLDDLHLPTAAPDAAAEEPQPLNTPPLPQRGRGGREVRASLGLRRVKTQGYSVPCVVLLCLWIALALLLGLPQWGANAGSLIVTAAAYGVGAAILLGRRPSWRLWLACSLAGFALAFALGAIEAATAGRASSHVGAALSAAGHGRGAAYLAAIAVRKLAMNLRLLFSPWLLLGAAVVVATMIAARALISVEWRALLTQRTWTARGLPALLAAVVSSLLFKDSGVVTVTFLVGAACVILLWYTLCTETA
jgi:hypothetical protein